MELRGHGRSGKPNPPYHWRAFGRDLAQLAARLELRGATGIGHSRGGHAIVLLAALAPETLARLLVIDPTIFPRERYGQPPMDASFTPRRKNHWHSAEEMVERLGSPPSKFDAKRNLSTTRRPRAGDPAYACRGADIGSWIRVVHVV